MRIGRRVRNCRGDRPLSPNSWNWGRVSPEILGERFPRTKGTRYSTRRGRYAGRGARACSCGRGFGQRQPARRAHGRRSDTDERGHCCGAFIANGKTGALGTIYAGATLATGGGQVFQHTTTPLPTATVWRWPGVLGLKRQYEFVQFHPTMFHDPDGPAF